MKWPSSRKSVPNGAVSCTSTAWKGDLKRSNSRLERTKKPVSSVRYSVSSPGCTSPAPLPSGIAASAMDRLEPRVLRRERVLYRAKEPFGLGRIVGRVVADVHVDRHEAVLGPGVNREVRFGEQHRARHALRREL